MKLNPGFVPAVGTPLDAEGNFIEASYKKQIEDQIAAGAVAILSMGSMGQQPYIKTGECAKVARAAVEAAAGRVPVFVGAMDVSVARAKERIAAMEDLDVAGFVFTTPFYYAVTPKQQISYFTEVAKATKHNILLYDLAVVTQSKITLPTVKTLIKTVPNLKGIKSADQQMFRLMKLDLEIPEDFIMVYSGLDTFDIAYRWGITTCLDGMMSCTPVNSKKLFDSMKEGKWDAAAEALNNILKFRDYMAANELWACYTIAMNLLGYEGSFGPDYVPKHGPEWIPEVRKQLEMIGEPVIA